MDVLGQPTSPATLGARSGAETLGWSLLYVLSQGTFLATHSGSYIDEYLHVFAGRDLVTLGQLPAFYTGEVYDRGLVVSALSGIATVLLGDQMWAAKLVPLLLGLASFVCLQALARTWWPNAIATRRFACLLFLVSPWTLFNHFYLRMYAVYELGLLANLWLLARLAQTWSQPQPQPRSAGRQQTTARRVLAIVIILNAGLWLGSRDPGALPVLLSAAVGLAYITVAALPGRSGGAPTRAVVALRLGGWAVLAVAALAMPATQRGLAFWLSGDLHFTSSAEHKYAELFFDGPWLWTLLFVAGLMLLWLPPKHAGQKPRSTRHARQTLGLVTGVLFCAHMVSSQDLQITRGILYFMPLYLVVGLEGSARITAWLATRAIPARAKSQAWLAAVATAAIGTLAIAPSYPPGFWRSPGIPSEISYIDYARLYATTRRLCTDSRLIDASPSPHIGLLYGVRPDVAIASPDGSKQDRMIEDSDGGARTVYGAIPVGYRLLTTKPSSRQQLPPEGASDCLIVRAPSAGRLLDRGFRKILKQRAPLARFENIALHRFPPGALELRPKP